MDTSPELVSESEADTAKEENIAAVGESGGQSRSWRRRLVPFALIAPAAIYLALFFAYPMYQGLTLALRDDDALLTLLEEPNIESEVADRLPQASAVDILDRQGNLLEDPEATDLLTELWMLVLVEEADGTISEGWAPESRVRIREESDDGSPLGGTIRPYLGDEAGRATDLYAESNERSEVVAQVAERSTATVQDTAILEVWYLVRSTDDPTKSQGWAPSRFVQEFGEGETGLVSRGNTGDYTTKFFEKMFDDRFFGPAVRTTLILIAIILPLQFVMALIMSLVIHARIRFSSGFLYVFSLPMGMSDLAVGILFFSIFTGNGLLNSILDGLGVTDGQTAFLTADTRNWILFAIILAELWRATSIVMVILVSGLQAIPDETLEAAQLFGASYWQRVRHVMLPLLRPSIQVALILRTILAFQVFAVVIALSGGDVVTVLANETYRQYFGLQNRNVASAYAMFILFLSLGSAVLYLRTVRTQTEVNAA